MKPLRVMTAMTLGFGAFMIGIPFAIAGILCCLTIVGIPLGLALIGFSGVPLGLVVSWYTKKAHGAIEAATYEQQEEDLADFGDGPAPWLNPEELN